MPTYIKVPKDPNDADDLTWDWALRLVGAETIATFTAIVVDGTWVAGTTSIVGAKTTVRMTGGVAGVQSSVRGRIVTSTGRQIDWTFYVPIEEQ